VPDLHTDEQGRYTVRSLYFDNYANRCFYENENGTEPREKFRIRIYNGSKERIMLECKRKEHGMTIKKSCPLTLAEAESLIKGKAVPNISNQPPLLRRLTLGMLTEKLSPKVIVEYERIPFVYKDGNVRVTLDLNLSSSSDVSSFLNQKINKRPIMPKETELLEVKFDEFLPDFIHKNLSLGNLRQTAFSKYYLCRKYKL
jgi:SPX domain protein involved in polyphosphate accumulation